jgi:hypothetical protein
MTIPGKNGKQLHEARRDTAAAAVCKWPVLASHCIHARHEGMGDGSIAQCVLNLTAWKLEGELKTIWRGMRNPYEADTSLTARPGSLRLNGSAVTMGDEDSPAFIGPGEKNT